MTVFWSIFPLALVVLAVAVGALFFAIDAASKIRDLPELLGWLRHLWNKRRGLAILAVGLVLLAVSGYTYISLANLRSNQDHPGRTSGAATATGTKSEGGGDMGPILPPGPCPADSVNASSLYGGDANLWRRTSSDVWQYGTEDNTTSFDNLSIPAGDEGEWKLQGGQRSSHPGPFIVKGPVVFARIRC